MTNKFLQFLGLIKKSGKLVEGYNKCEDYIKKKQKIFCIILSKDISPNTSKKFINYCNESNIPIINDYTKEELSNMLGKDEINVIGVSDKNMCERLIELWKQERNI